MSATIDTPLRRYTDITDEVRKIIVLEMSRAPDQNAARLELIKRFRITEQSIVGIMAQDKLQRETDAALITQYTQSEVSTITKESEAEQVLRAKISESFDEMIGKNRNKVGYDYYVHIYLLARDFGTDLATIEAYLTRTFHWLSVKLYLLKHTKQWTNITDDTKDIIRDFIDLGRDENDKDERRKQMAREYGVSVYIIGMITAWKKMMID